ncbi:MAG TPA: hypothetical protein VFC41_07370 [Anaerovoracaceae bacterium]|nr:hypothetical protein [Anaerovoracaceae bacterium]
MKLNLATLAILLLTCYFGFSQNTSGVYNTDFKEMTISQNGNMVTGTYKHSNGRIEGTLNGLTLTGLWFQDNGKGKFVFEFNSDFSGYIGKWGYNDATPSGKWNGTKIGVNQTSNPASQNTQQKPQDSSPNTTTEAPASKSSNPNAGLNKAEATINNSPQKNKIQGQEAEIGAEPEKAITTIKRRPLNATEKSLVENAKRDLGKAITDEKIADSERLKNPPS